VDSLGRSSHGSSGYRGAAVRCPGCAEPMTIENLADAEVDVCASCGGMWVDWFDGEVKRVATAVLATEQHFSRPSAPPSSLRNEVIATGACPRCTRQLTIERYVVKVDVGRASDGPRTSVTQTTGADLLRCEDCAGVFVPRASAALLATLPADEEAPPPSTSAGPGVLEPLPWQRFMAVVRRLLGLGASS
jgi:Zn-finger nucleic acid-binding protein